MTDPSYLSDLPVELFELIAWYTSDAEPDTARGYLADMEKVRQSDLPRNYLPDILMLACVCHRLLLAIRRLLLAAITGPRMRCHSDAVLSHVGGELTELRIKDKSFVTDIGLAYCTRLTSLSLKGLTAISREPFILEQPGIEPLCRRLTSLALVGREVDDYSAADCTTLTDSVIRLCTNLTRLDLTLNWIVSDDGIRPLVSLTSLNLTSDPYGDVYCLFSHVSGGTLYALTNITSLNLKDNVYVCDQVLTCLTHLRDLNVSYESAISNVGVSALTNLTSLHLRRKPKITNDGIKGLVNLTFLDLSGNWLITDAGIESMTNLRTLVLAHVIVTPEISNELLNLCTRLKSLILIRNTQICDDGVKNLSNLTYLHLSISITSLTDEALSRLASLNPEIKIVKSCKWKPSFSDCCCIDT